MFIHIGNGEVVFHNELIGIFDLAIVTGKGSPVEGGACKTAAKKARSLVVTERLSFYSPISTATLYRRNKSFA